MQNAQITDSPLAPQTNSPNTSLVETLGDTSTPATSPKLDVVDPAKDVNALKDTKSELFAQKFAELQREKRILRDREAKLKEMEQKAKSGITDEDYERFKKLKDKKSPRQLLDLLGMDLQAFNETALNEADEPPAVLEVKEKLKLIEKQLKDKELEMQKREQESAHQGFKNHILNEITANKAEFAALVSGDPDETKDHVDTVFEVMKLEFERTGVEPTVTEAARKVNAHILSETKKYFARPWIEELAKAEYFEKWGLAKPKETSDNSIDPQSRSTFANNFSEDQQNPRTITNSMSQAATQNDRDLSDDERRQKALNILMSSR